eukprot:TRINITY_DN697_c0_g2_i1.p2 TRINITY_DN697_c0_g2~~TRINITY_DN697_c0_g2_i1.p2  ORF type:complete len:151 (-),score=8.57 TRINITY_DN697_c0_g2_i1:233-685(-)
MLRILSLSLVLIVVTCQGFYNEASDAAIDGYIASFNQSDIISACEQAEELVPYTIAQNGTQFSGNLTLNNCKQLQEEKFIESILVDQYGDQIRIEIICDLVEDGVCELVDYTGEARALCIFLFGWCVNSNTYISITNSCACIGSYCCNFW